jgi:hypothetical protein
VSESADDLAERAAQLRAALERFDVEADPDGVDETDEVDRTASTTTATTDTTADSTLVPDRREVPNDD